MKQITSITDVTSDLNNDGLSVNVEVNRQLAARYGITAATIDNALYDALGQRIVSTIFNQSSQYRVILVAKPESLPTLQSLGNLYLPSQTSSTGQVPLSGIANIKITKSPLVISHLAQFPVGHHLVQSGPGCLAQQGGGRDQSGRKGGATAAVDHLLVPRRRAGVPGFAVERGVPADRGAGRRVHRARRAL